MFGCTNDRLFPEKYTLKDHISNTKLETGKKVYSVIFIVHYVNLYVLFKKRTGVYYQVRRVEAKPGDFIPNNMWLQVFLTASKSLM